LSCSEWKKVNLGDIAIYSNERVNTTDLTLRTYISTENLLPERGGKTIASSLPVGKVVRFRKGQILVSNIRPYFRKIWHASFDVGCSADVLVLNPEVVDSKFLYYCLCQDCFFDYVMAGSKGTKMPRGDKKQIMMFPFKLPTNKEQKAIAHTLSCLDDKIELNNRINKTLEEMAQAIFKSWFVDFEPFQDGEFEDSELGPIPKGWRVVELGEVIKFVKGRKPLELLDEQESKDQSRYLTISVLNNGQAQFASIDKMILADELDILMVMDGASSGSVYFGNHGIVGSTLAKVEVVNDQLREIILQYLKLTELEISRHNTGSAIPHTDKGYVLSRKVALPSESEIAEIAITLSELRKSIIQNKLQCNILESLRDTLLPKLMSGEIRVPIEEG